MDVGVLAAAAAVVAVDKLVLFVTMGPVMVVLVVAVEAKGERQEQAVMVAEVPSEFTLM